jgi:hypothetical protein
MDLLNLIISLVSGLAGGNAAGAAMKDKGLGTLGNSAAGVVGGGLGNWILQALGVLAAATAHSATGAAVEPSSSLDLGAILANVVGSGAGGAVLTALISLLKNAIPKQ